MTIRFTRSFTAILAVLLLGVSTCLQAQTVKVKFLHNASGVSFDTLDVYIDSLKIDNVPFRYGTAMLDIAAGNHKIYVNHKTSTDTLNQLLGSFPNISFSGAFPRHFLAITGVDTPARYRSNPDGQSTALNVFALPMGLPTLTAGNTAVVGMHGATDVPFMDMVFRGGNTFQDNIRYNGLPITGTKNVVTSATQTIDVYDSSKLALFGSYTAPLATYNQKPVFVFASGFAIPSQNKNGAAFALCLVDTNAGQATVLASVAPPSLPSAKMQLIHNAASVNADTVDIYSNGVKWLDNFAFRKATGLLNISSGLNRITINGKNSTDSGNAVIFRTDWVVAPFSTNIVMFSGVDSPSNYVVNPNAKNTAFRLVVKRGMSFLTTNNTLMVMSAMAGVTDATALSFQARGSVNIAQNIMFGDTAKNDLSTAFSLVSTSSNIIDIFAGTNLVSSHAIDLGAYAKKSLVLFSSGFADTSALNKNGKKAGLFALDTTGNVMRLPEVGKLQIIHNSPDVTLDSIDVWVNGVKAANKLAFRTSFVSLLNEGNYTITFTKKNSVSDTASATKLATFSNQSIQNTGYYLAVVNGVIDVNKYGTNPDAVSTVLNVKWINGFREYPSATNTFETIFMHGVPDAPTYDFNQVTQSVKKGNNIKYLDVTGFTTDAGTGTVFYNLTNADSTLFYASYTLNLANEAGRTGVFFTSGVLDTLGNKAKAKLMALYLARPNGVVSEVARLTGVKVQIVHASADVSLDSIDVYINAQKALSNFRFRKATPMMDFNAGVPIRISLAPRNSTSVTQAFYDTTMVFSSGKNYYLVANGLVNPNDTLYMPNPDGGSTKFNLAVSDKGRLTSTVSKNVDVMFFNAVTDIKKISILGYNQANYIAKSVGFGSFYGYNPSASVDNQEIQLLDAANEATIMARFNGLLGYGTGKTCLVYNSGFYNTKKIASDSSERRLNKKGYRYLLMVVYPDGKLDTFQSIQYVGLNKSLTDFNQVVTYPNPSNGRITVQLNSSIASPVNLMVYDLSGKLCAQQIMQAQSGSNLMDWNLSDLSEGAYLLRIQSAESVTTQKLIIAK